MTPDEDTQKLITNHARRLQKLREQRATFGAGTPPYVLTEIEDIEAELRQLQSGLQTEQATLAGLSERGLPVAEALAQVGQQLAEIKTLLAQRNTGGVSIGNVYGNISGSTIAGGDVNQTVSDQRGQRVGRQTNIQAGAGSVIGSHAGGDIIAGSGHTVNKPGGDYVEGDKITTGDISNSAAALGRGAQATLNQGTDAGALAAFFTTVYREIDRATLAPADKEDAKAEVGEIEATAKEDPAKVDDSFLARRLRNLERMAPDIIDVILATVANPMAGLGVVGAKIKAKAEEIKAARGKAATA